MKGEKRDRGEKEQHEGQRGNKQRNLLELTRVQSTQTTTSETESRWPEDSRACVRERGREAMRGEGITAGPASKQ
jgi:hypothetical protein